MIKAVQDSMAQWKIRSGKHRQKRDANVVCYGELGCFEDSGPFGYIDMLPNSPEEIDTKFYVFSTKNRFVKSSNLRNKFVTNSIFLTDLTIRFYSFRFTTFRLILC